ncbi:ABC transporter ATP-binding protein [Rhizobium paknamense]|uniref:Multiple sugar transport system ATP-binding protein n=1 Tax=Rhizobium paknamense TaxID=1206817 RepID=A0ABU0IF19_9HYPH|nr:sn-glycerol-3-phosphate ABC transporter ATP-binding protein UgpC [Rhizobium paknamense]MDQ0455856.1 multiple sugar transport system ATP-binding protein [Rhizobium paknamense]
MAGLALSKIVKQYGTHTVLHGIDLTVRDGEFTVLVGPSGCGKSTLLRSIAGLESISSGTIEIGGRDVTALPSGERGLSMVFQSYALYPHMTVRKNLSFGLENMKLPRQEIDARVMEAARMLAIEPLMDRRPKQLSGGQRQRVAIGRAIVRQPKVFLFDEPLSNLDAALRVQTRGEISRLHKRLGATMIYVTHDQIEAMTMADRIAVLNGGRLEQYGAPLELFDFPANKFVAGFIGSPQMNFFDGTITDLGPESVTVSITGFGALTLPVDSSTGKIGDKVTLGARPNHFRLGKAEGRPMIEARLSTQYAESVGTETYIYGKIEGHDRTVILHLPDHVAIADSEVLDICIPAARLHLFHGEAGLSFAKKRHDGSLIAGAKAA